MSGRGTWRSLVIGAVACTCLISQARSETLTDAFILSYQNSGLLEQNRALLRAADEDVASAVAAIRPSIQYFVSSAQSFQNTLTGQRLNTNAGLTADLTLLDFGRNRLAIEAAKETVLATREALVGVEQQVLLRTVNAFMSVRREAEFVQLRENNVRLISEELQAARDRFEVGEVTRTDVAQAESRLAAARASLAAAEGAFAQAREEYRAAVGQYPGPLSAPPTAPQTASSLNEAQANARVNHPDIKGAQRNVTVAELNQARATANRKPSVSLIGRSSISDQGNSDNSIGLELGGVIYQGGQLRALERRAAAQKEASRAALLLVNQQVALNAGNAWAGLMVARSQIEATDRQIRAAQIAYRGTREEASLGARTTLDVLDAEQELLDARANRASAEADAQIAAYNLLSSMGLLTVRDLNLDIATYDPTEYYNAVGNAPVGSVSEQGKRLDALMKRLGYE